MDENVGQQVAGRERRRDAARVGAAALGQRALVVVPANGGLGFGVADQQQATHGRRLLEAARSRKPAAAKGRSDFSALPAAQEGEPLEQMHVLLVLQQRAVQRRDQLPRVALAQASRARRPR